MKMRFVFGLLASLAFLPACSSPGEIGEACSTSGSTDECVENAVCTNNSDASTYTCRKLCTVQEDCSSEEACNGIAGSNLKSCQPK